MYYFYQISLLISRERNLYDPILINYSEKFTHPTPLNSFHRDQRINYTDKTGVFVIKIIFRVKVRDLNP